MNVEFNQILFWHLPMKLIFLLESVDVLCSIASWNDTNDNSQLLHSTYHNTRTVPSTFLYLLTERITTP